MISLKKILSHKSKKFVDFLRGKILHPEIVFLLLLIVGFFIVLPPSLNYGDQASWGLIFQKNLLNYQQTNYSGSFSDYLKNQYREFHQEKLQLPDAYDTYGLDVRVGLSSLLDPTHYIVFVLSGLSQITIFNFFGGLLDIETVLMIFGFLIFVFTYIYAYKLGKILIDRYFGIILAILVVSNVYFNQLVRSMLFPFITLFPLIFCMSFYYLLLAHRKDNYKRWWPSIGLATALAFSFLNGYSNTNVLLLGLLFVFFFVLVVDIIILKISNYRLLNLQKYAFILFFTIGLVTFISGLWSNFLGENGFYAINEMIHNRVLGFIFGGGSGLSSLMKFHLRTLPGYIIDFFRALLIASKDHGMPHEPSFLNDISFFNIIEFLFFFVGIFYTLRRVFSKNLVNHLLLVFGIYFLWRFLGNPGNYIIVARYSYDIYFAILFFAAIGFYQFFSFFGKKRRAFFLCAILLISLFFNVYTFNKNFVWLYGESLNQFYGLYPLRKLYQNEISKGKNIIVYNYTNASGYMYHIDLYSLLENRVDYEVMSKFFLQNKISSLNSLKTFIDSGNYNNYYFILPTGVARIGKNVISEPDYSFPPALESMAPYFTSFAPYRVIRNRRGIPSFFVYKLSRETLK